MVSTADDKTVRGWNTSDGSEVWQCNPGSSCCLSVTPDCSSVVVVDNDSGEITLINTMDGRIIFKSGSNGVGGWDVSCFGDYIVSGHGGKMMLWEMMYDSGDDGGGGGVRLKLINSWKEAHNRVIRGVKFCNYGGTLVSCNSGGSVCVYDVIE